MPKAIRGKAIYARGSYRLDWRADRATYEVTWYDQDRKRERRISAGSSDLDEARAALDRQYLASAEGRNLCPTCGQPTAGGSALLTSAIADYLVEAHAKPSIDAITARLNHVLDYVETRDAGIRCDVVDEAYIDDFRAWMIRQPIISPTGLRRTRAPSTIENSVLQLAAVINAAFARRQTRYPAQFRPIQLVEVNASPDHRSDIAELAAMFRYAIAGGERTDNLLRFLRAGVATWARPDAIYDISTEPKRRQWKRKAHVLALNPHGRRQTRKYRATIPIARQFAVHLDATDGNYVPVKSIRSAWDTMAAEIGLPRDGEAGTKLLRRSMAQLVRDRIGEEHWVQGRIFLGHHKAEFSDIYALMKPANLGRALAATEDVIDEIEELAPGAFYPHLTPSADNVVSIGVR